MRLTRKRAIELSIELWEWLAETGKAKWEWEGWKRYGETEADCFLCEYNDRKKPQIKGDSCHYCPYHKCYTEGDYFELWEYAKTPEGRKKYAKLFLEQLRTLEV